MRMTTWSIASASVGIALLLVSVSGQRPRPAAAHAPDEILVKFKSTASASQRDRVLTSHSASRIRRFDGLNIDHVRLPAGLALEAALAAFEANLDVQFAQPNYVRRLIQSAPPDDPFWLDGRLWGLNKIQAQAAWTTFTAGNGSVVVADIDTGINYTHPDLAANMWHNPLEIPGNGIDDDGNGYVDDVYGIDTVNHDSDPFDDHGHGTHTSGTIAAVGNNGLGVTGVNWNAKLLACKFLSGGGSGTDAGAIECFNYIVALKNRGVNIRVSSNSWGQARGSDPPGAVLQAAIDAAGTAGIINIFGAGNDGTNNDTAPFDPASYSSPSVVAVASSSSTDRRSSFSNYGATSVDLAAPGENILSTYLDADYVELSGTSMATPHVAGVAALLAALDPSLSVTAIKSLLLDNVDQMPRWNSLVVSGGRLNAYRAAAAVSPGTPNAPPAVSITSPVDGTVFTLPATIAVAAGASDSDGSITSVTFYANGATLGGDSTSPYGVTWSNVPPGNYTLTAVAVDNLGAIATSAPVHVVVPANLPPTVSITTPAEGTVLTSPASLSVAASAGDSDGTVQQVAFFANGVAIGTDATSPYNQSWNVPTGSYTLTAVATDNLGATTTSTPVHVTVNPIPGRLNVAASANGGLAIASSTYSPSYPASGTNNGDRKGASWGSGGGWNDGTENASPDWLEVDFNSPKLVEEVNVFSMQDNYSAPSEPTQMMTFTTWGLRGFEAQYWDGATWVTIPGASVATNTLVWRQFVFSPLTTSKIRVYITAALNGYSRVMEVEAWGIASGSNSPPSVSIGAPAEGAAYTAPATLSVSAAASDGDGVVQQVAFYANGTLIGSDATAPYSVTWSNVAAGSYTLTAVATDNAGAPATSAPVHVTVAANVAPSVSITAPAEGASATAPAAFSVSASANDSDGSIASVTFYVGGAAIGTDTASPYSLVWSNVAAGSYTLTAVAADNLGATTTSAAVHVTVNPVPGRLNMALAANGGSAIGSSTLGASYPAAATINGDRKGLNWGAGGGWNDGTENASPDWLEIDFNSPKSIDEVNVFSMQDAYSAPVEPTQALTFSSWGLRAFEIQYWNGAGWVTVPGGSVTSNNLVWRQFLFEAVTTSRMRVYITAALNGYSRVMEVEAWGVTSGTNAPPTVSIGTPADGATAIAPATFSVSVTAADGDGVVQQVAFYANGTLIGTDASSPYGLTWSNVAAGSYTLTAVATDNAGGTTTSAPVHVTVAANAAPTVSITAPGEASTFTAPAAITLAAAASDSDGSIASVAFYANGAPIGTDTTSPYGLTWSNAAAGVYTLTAVATDNLGLATTSAAVHVTVNPAPGRMNFALPANGGTATASSTYNANYPAAGAINGDRKGLKWGAGGGWNDGTENASPDWIEIDFNGPKTIDEVNVFSMQDNYSAPVEPTTSMTFAYWGLRAFEIQYWNGTSWVTVPGASVTGNSLVWRQFLFSAVTTSKIRVYITGALNGFSRVMEVEAWGSQ